ncbi:MAG: hypothetical protein AVDCRST_MAG17-998, partial [uncultured Solirubrobacterales bacterium]
EHPRLAAAAPSFSARGTSAGGARLRGLGAQSVARTHVPAGSPRRRGTELHGHDRRRRGRRRPGHHRLLRLRLRARTSLPL